MESGPHFWIKLVATVAPEAFASYELIAGQGGNNSSFGTTNQRDSLPLRNLIEMDGQDSFLFNALIDHPPLRVPSNAGTEGHVGTSGAVRSHGRSRCNHGCVVSG
jgi:hypothetical protein